MARGLLLVLLAVPVCSGIVSTMVVKITSDVGAGLAIERGDLLTAGIFGGGSLLVIAIAGSAVWRGRASKGWQVYGLLLATLTVLGFAGGAVAGGRISAQRVEYEHAAAHELCVPFVALHPQPLARCEARALRCAEEVRAHPRPQTRGVGLEQASEPGEPHDYPDRATWECVARP